VNVRRSTSARRLLGGASLALLGVLAGASATAAAPIGTVTEFSKGITRHSEPWAITAGPDGNLWIAENGGEYKGERFRGAIARITPSGTVTEFTAGLEEGSAPQGITTGPDGNLWFTDAAGRIGRITPAGAITEFSKGISSNSEPSGIAAGPDGNLWFTERFGSRIGRITPAGVVTEFTVGLTSGENPQGITAGPDGNLWFTEEGHFVKPSYVGGAIGKVTPAGEITEFKLKTSGTLPNAITQGPDGNLWFAQDSGRIGRITTSGAVTEFSEHITPGSEPLGIATGADGNLWFGEYALHHIGRITPSGVVTEFEEGVSESSPRAIAAGPDGNLWFAQLDASESSPASVGTIVSGAAPALVAAPAVTGGAVAGVPQQCSGAQWSAWAGLQPASNLFGFDGYKWLLDGAPVAGGQSFAPSAAEIGHALSCTATVTYSVLGVTASATSAAVTVLAPPATPPPVAPVLGALKQSASKWREGSALASISRKRRPPVGTTFSFTLSEQATVSVTFTQQVAGRKVKGKCLAPTSRNRHGHACTRTLTQAPLSLAGHPGLDKIVFKGRLTGSRKLALGAYTVTIVAVNGAGQRSQARSLRFTIVK